MKFIIHIFVTALALIFVSYLIPGIVVTGLYSALIAAFILGVLNVFVKPILFILTLPITLLTLGLFIFVLNASLFLFAASFISGFEVQGFVPALIGSVLISLVSTISSQFTS